MTAAVLFAQEALTRDDFVHALPQNLAFAIIAGIMLFSAFKMVTTGNVVHAALYLMIVLAASAAIFILLGSDFVGATQILVYIGAIIVLFLFGIMLTKAQLGDDDSVGSEQRSMGALVGALLLVVIGFALVDTFDRTAIGVRDEAGALVRDEAGNIVQSDPEPVAFQPSTVDVDDLPTPVISALGLEGRSGTVWISEAAFDSLEPEVQRRLPGAEVFGNNKQIADSIFSQYIVPFEAVSVLLLAALIGAVVVARKE